MGTVFWVRRFLVVFAGAFVLIAGAHVLRGRALDYAVTEGLLWSAVAAAVFVAVRLYHSRRGRACALCGDTPPGLPPGPGGKP